MVRRNMKPALLLLVPGVACAKKSPVQYIVNAAGDPAAKKIYKTFTAGPAVYSDTALNVHIVPHTHDDVGWLKTVDQYFYGSNNTIQHAGVQYVISSVVAELLKDPSRTFTYVEMAFFSRWFYEQTPELQESVRGLVAAGQLSFANGGWCMHDEAAAHYAAMIDQTTLGHAFLAKEFGYQPRVGWQIDPFGHSATQASLLSWGAGFDALYFGRIDYQDRALRQETQQCEGVWRSSESLGEDAQVFWGLTGQYGGNYYGPDGFDWDVETNNAIPLMDDERLHDYNVDGRVAAIKNAALSQAAMTKGNHIMMTMGGDFQYESATQQFTNLDKLIHYTNLAEGQTLNLFYSTPTLYADAKHSEGIAWTVKTDDFFPYADSAHAFWTGYFTSRPLLKRFERVTSGWLQAARQLEVLAKQGPLKEGGAQGSTLFTLEMAQAVAQHHDAVSGTSKQHVAHDYAQRLSAGLNQAYPMATAALASLSGLKGTTLEFCPLLNVSVCEAAAAASSAAAASVLAVVAYNPLAKVRAGEVLRVPVASPPASVTDAATGERLEFQVVASAWSPDPLALEWTAFVALPDIGPLAAATALLHFNAPAKAAGAQKKGSIAAEAKEAVRLGAVGGSFDVTSGLVTLTFSNATGALTTMAYSGTGAPDPAVSASLTQAFGYYVSFDTGLEGYDLGECDPDTWQGCPDLDTWTPPDVDADASTSTATGNRWAPDDDMGLGVIMAAAAKRFGPRKVARAQALVRSLKAQRALPATALHRGVGNSAARLGAALGAAHALAAAPRSPSSSHAASPVLNCSAADAAKVDCGFNGIMQAQCEAAGCCWAEAAGSVPWCFSPTKPPDYSYQNGGAYIFRPSEPDASLVAVGMAGTGHPTAVTVVSGPLVTEVRQAFGPWINQTVRLVRGSSEAEFSFSIGPVPIDDGLGKEMVSRFTSSINNGDAPSISTDSNGREFLARTFDVMPTWNRTNAEPVAGNYYPVNAAASIKDAIAQLSVVVDRSVGAASLREGELEVMVHRRLLVDDSRGVGEPLDEYDSSDTGSYLNCKAGSGIVVAGAHSVRLQHPSSAMAGLRASMDNAFAPLLLAFATVDAAAAKAAKAAKAAVKASSNKAPLSALALPPNVKLLTLQAASATQLLVRLEHGFALGEDAALSAPACVNVTALVEALGFNPSGAVEVTLTANQALADLTRLDWPTEGQSINKAAAVKHAAAAKRAEAFGAAVGGGGDGMVTLNPMEIRTALITVF